VNTTAAGIDLLPTDLAYAVELQGDNINAFVQSAICKLSLPLQVHWVFGSRLHNSSVTLANASLQLMHEAPPTGAGK
jgi:uncharacterized membrane protein YfbV (UPF0208 family)